ncbi:hypothetical protein HUG10_05745 [Halorarum halophilum]|uniref:Halobacterial output domain-containing protein n=1 Tax=Halorarum halophilum TaxID=2743090 RepID=A0A7D5KET1_9EURY|nr:HalOD1 output domain-containing protein [Halobaculum halophilum]QLG27076.1 hypothetical protein HUG10_05745 [Halobaculum halophilum]
MDQHQRGPTDDTDDASGFGLCSFAEFEYRPKTNSYEARYDEQTVPPSIAVIGAMSLLLDEAPEDLVSLGESVDLEALDALLSSGASRVGNEASVSFRYYERDISVDTEGTITVGEPVAEEADIGANGRVSSTTL